MLRMQILMTERQRKMLEWLARRQDRSMSSVLRMMIERAYHAETQRAEGSGIAKAVGTATGRAE